MSRAIPSNQQEYKFDQASQLTGIIVDGNIMPLRDAASTGLNGQLCIRGIDPMFLMEAVYGRRFCRGSSNSGSAGLDDNAVRKLRLQLLRNAIAGDKQYWTPTDPVPNFLWWNFGSSNPGDAAALAQLTANFQNWNQASANDTYDTLRQDEITHLFQDVKNMNYSWLYQTQGSGWAGFTRSWDPRYIWVRARGHMDGTTTTTSGVNTTPIGYLWRQEFQLQVEKNLGYPDDIRNMYSLRQINADTQVLFECVITAGWESRLNCMQLKPHFLIEVNNAQNVQWTQGGQTRYDSYNETRYVLVSMTNTYWDFSEQQYIGGYVIREEGAGEICKDIFTKLQNTDPTAHGWHYSVDDMTLPAGFDENQADAYTIQRTSYVSFVRDFYLCHMMYCNLENTPV